MKRLFVVGSLRKGEFNHERFAGFGDKLIAVGTIGGALLKDLGAYPAMLPSPNERDRVTGEVYEISDELAAEIDRFEHEDGFVARPVSVSEESEAGREAIRAEAYFFGEPDRLAGEKTIEGGDWARYDHRKQKIITDNR